MSPPNKKMLQKGAAGYGYEPGDENFLAIDRDPFDASASGHGYSARYDDDYGYRRGQGEYSDELDDGLKLQNRLPDEQRQVSDKMRDILDDVDGMGTGNTISGNMPLMQANTVGGGGALPKSRGVGSGKPRVAPKDTKPFRTNSRD
jgi:hypothetical protein